MISSPAALKQVERDAAIAGQGGQSKSPSKRPRFYFRVSRLEAALERGLELALCLGVARAFAEQIRIVTKVLDGCESDRVDAPLDQDKASGWKFGDPVGERFDEIIEFIGGQRAIDPAVSLCELRVVILCAQHDLERTAAAHEAREVLHAAAAGAHAESRLRLSENRGLPRGEAHVARQHELAAGGAHAPLDLRDGDEAAGTEVAEQKRDRRFADQLCRFVAVLLDLGDVDVGNEIVGVGAFEHHHLEVVVGLGLPNEGNQIADQFRAKQVHRRGGNCREQNGSIFARVKRCHERSPCQVSCERLIDRVMGPRHGPASWARVGITIRHASDLGPRAPGSRPQSTRGR